MTFRDVLNRLRSSFYPQDMETTEYVAKLEEACEKQIEKKIVYTTSTIRCPVCNKQLTNKGCIKPNIKYCKHCGQKLNWEVVE